MDRFKGVAVLLAVVATAAPAMASAQSTPRIVMRRPLNAPSTSNGSQTPACGVEGQPACPTDCDYVGAVWDVGQWSGDACGAGGTVTRTVQCLAVRANGQRVPREDAFCLQDAETFHSSCNATPIGTAPEILK